MVRIKKKAGKSKNTIYGPIGPSAIDERSIRLHARRFIETLSHTNSPST